MALSALIVIVSSLRPDIFSLRSFLACTCLAVYHVLHTTSAVWRPSGLKRNETELRYCLLQYGIHDEMQACFLDLGFCSNTRVLF